MDTAATVVHGTGIPNFLAQQHDGQNTAVVSFTLSGYDIRFLKRAQSLLAPPDGRSCLGRGVAQGAVCLTCFAGRRALLHPASQRSRTCSMIQTGSNHLLYMLCVGNLPRARQLRLHVLRFFAGTP